MLTVKRAAGKAGRVCIASGMIFGLSVSAAAAIPPGATILYDAGGFENTSRFSPIDSTLTGQDSGAWSEAADPSTTATISDDVTIGSQSVEVFRADNEIGEWFPTVTGAPSTTQKTVVTEWSQYVEASSSTDAFGPFFGIEVNNATSSGVNLLGALYVDAFDGSLWSLTSFNGTTTPTSGTFDNPGDFVTLDAWNDFKIELDFDDPDGQITIFAKSSTASTFTQVYTDDFAAKNFIGADLTGFTDAAIKTLFANEDTASKAQEGTAYFDDYVVYMIPEPTSLAALGLAGLVMLGRRGRRAA